MIRQSLAAAPAALALAVSAFALAAAACAPVEAEPPAFAEEHNMALLNAIDASTRTPANVARDRYRHPYETLSFFGVRPTDTVVEIWPGGGWYTEILAPYVLQGGGRYYAAAAGANGHNGVRRLIEANPSLYGGARLVAFPATQPDHERVPDGSADVVLTFRNVHNWLGSEGRDPMAEEAFRQMYAMLRPGGTLGVVEHRLPEDQTGVAEATSGYVRVSTVRRLAEAAGFRFVAESELNANPNDSHDHPEGVWTLPPTLRLGDTDRERYLAIGESDRMTLRFIKPR